MYNRKRKLNWKIGSGDKQTYQVAACMGNEPSEQDIKNSESLLCPHWAVFIWRFRKKYGHERNSMTQAHSGRSVVEL